MKPDLDLESFHFRLKVMAKRKNIFCIFTYELFVFSLICIISSCGIIERHPESGYGAYSTKSNSVKRTQSQPPASATNLDNKTRLKKLENAIATKKELEQYSRVLPYLKDEDERIEFLALGDYEAKQKYLKDANINSRTIKSQDDYRELVEAQDIGIGMTQNLVRKSWGEPDNIEVSGNPLFRNERWKYNKYVSTPDGYKPEKKIVYFEGGRVVGWEVE